jgi:hypothetical protein
MALSRHKGLDKLVIRGPPDWGAVKADGVLKLMHDALVHGVELGMESAEGHRVFDDWPVVRRGDIVVRGDVGVSLFDRLNESGFGVTVVGKPAVSASLGDQARSLTAVSGNSPAPECAMANTVPSRVEPSVTVVTSRDEQGGPSTDVPASCIGLKRAGVDTTSYAEVQSESSRSTPDNGLVAEVVATPRTEVMKPAAAASPGTPFASDFASDELAVPMCTLFKAATRTRRCSGRG